MVSAVEKLIHEQLVLRQKQRSGCDRNPVTVVLNSIRSLYNVGSIFRTADGVGVEKIWLCGATGHPPRRQITKTALGAEARTPWEYRGDVVSVLTQLKKENYQIVLLEQTDESIPYQEFMPQFPVCLVLGNEIEGVDTRLLSFCDNALEIEMEGVKNSLNVAVAFGIVAYHFKLCLKNLTSAVGGAGTGNT